MCIILIKLNNKKIGIKKYLSNNNKNSFKRHTKLFQDNIAETFQANYLLEADD